MNTHSTQTGSFLELQDWPMDVQKCPPAARPSGWAADNKSSPLFLRLLILGSLYLNEKWGNEGNGETEEDAAAHLIIIIHLKRQKKCAKYAFFSFLVFILTIPIMSSDSYDKNVLPVTKNSIFKWTLQSPILT